MKYFVSSDLHSFATETKTVLKQAGFDKKNKNHTLIVCGDIFDRGDESLEIYKFLNSIPKKRCILIKGNHESLYFDLLQKAYPQRHDYSNGTVRTFCNIAKKPFKLLEDEEWLEIREIVKNHEVTKWLQTAQWVDYFELDKYIFVHSFIPTFESFDDLEFLSTEGKFFKDWRTKATDRDWEKARWSNPITMYKNGYFDHEKVNGKTLVVGHWHAWDFHQKLGGEIASRNRNIYYSNNLIALDGGVTQEWYYEYILIPHPNVLVIDDSDFSSCFDQWGSKLAHMEAFKN